MSNLAALGATATLIALVLVASTTIGDTQEGQWQEGRQVRVATGPALRPLAGYPQDAGVMPTIAHGYAELVAQHSGLEFVEHVVPSSDAAIAAVCAQQADLVLAQGGPSDQRLPCAGLVASRGFPGGRSALAGRRDQVLPRYATDMDGLRVAAVQGGPYPYWLATRYPKVEVVPMPSRHATLAAVESGAADAAIGLEGGLRRASRRDFNGNFAVHPLEADFPGNFHLLARGENQALLDQIEQALAAITIEEHANLLQRWARQVLPGALDRALDTPGASLLPWLPVILLPGIAVLAGVRRGRSRKRARALEQSQAHTAGIVNHEVRNSAQTMMTAIELLKGASLPAGARELVGAAASAGQSLRNLLNRTLELSRLASGRFRPHPQPCAPDRLLEQALAAVSPQAAQKGLRLRLALPPQAMSPVLVDGHCLRQIVDNLLGNALKFTDTGGVELRTQLDTACRPATLLIEVIDSGIGITPQQLADLFRPFQQADGGRQRGGSGLGLSICRQLAQAMGGTLDVHSVHGRGSRFTLRLPVQALDAGALQEPGNARAKRSPALALAGLRVLLVEDHALNRQVIAGHLRRLGAEVCEADDAASALALQSASPAGLVLLDIELGDDDGYTLARRLRQQEHSNDPPARLVALSAHGDEKHVHRCGQAGIDHVLIKPLRIAQLLELLGLPGEPVVIVDLQTQWSSEYDEDIRAGLSHLQRAIDTRNAPALRHHAHRLQGALQMRGVSAMQEVANDLWRVGNAAAPDWADAERLLRVLRVWRGDSRPAAAPVA